MQPQTYNTTDATRGQLIGERVLARKAELEAALADIGDDERVQRNALETAIATVEELITGDLDHPSTATAASLNTWLEHNKHLAGGDRPEGDKKQKPPQPPRRDPSKPDPDAMRHIHEQRDPKPASNEPRPGDRDDNDAEDERGDRQFDLSQVNDGDAKGPGPLPGDEDRLAHIPGDLLQR